jgi:hypothetical protein
MKSLNFDLRIERTSQDTYRSLLLHSPAGEAQSEWTWPPDLWETLRSGERTRQQMRRVGERLFETMLAGELRTRYAVSREAARTDNAHLRIHLRLAAPELHSLPWERLYDAHNAEFVALSAQTPLVRYLDVPQPLRPLQIAPPLRILGLVADPVDMAALDAARERQWLEDAIRPLQEAGLVDFTWLESPTARALQDALQRDAWHLFHFIGHGLPADGDGGEGALLLADENRRARSLSASGLARLLADHAALRLVVLNACDTAVAGPADPFSGVATALVRRGLPAVLAMQEAISDAAAIECTRSFYGALANGLPVDVAATEARKAMSLLDADSIEWAVPVLYMRAPDGVLWQMDAETGEQIDDQEDAMQDRSQQPWWEQVAIGTGDIDASNAGGDVIVANVGAGSRNVAVGKNITQQIVETLGGPTPDDRTRIQEQFAQLMPLLDSAQIAPRTAGRAEAELERLQEELCKTGDDETPDADTITRIGDWLLENVPDIAKALTELFGMPAVGRVLAKAGRAAVDWARVRFGHRATNG